MTDTRTASQARSAVKDGPVAKRRRRARYVNLPCAWCGLSCYWGTDRNGRGAEDGTTGHLLAHTNGGTYAWANTAPSCGTCQRAVGTRDMTGMVAPVVSVPSERDAVAFLSTYVADAREGMADAATRDAARLARLGF